MFDNMFQDKVVVITGGTSGIGEATALAFAKKGANVIILGRNADAGIRIRALSDSLDGSIDFFQCNIMKQTDIDKFVLYINKKFYGVDVLFNNAGIMPESKELEKITNKEWKSTIDSNLNGAFYITRALKLLIFQNKGCIINNTSIAGMQSYVAGRSYAYSAAKSALIQLTRQMALNYAEEGVRVNAVAPGIIETRILGNRDRSEYSKRIPLGYIGDPDVVADTVLFLASDYARYITGVVLPVDGGGVSFIENVSSIDSSYSI